MHVSALFLYPVKSCRRIELREALVMQEGLAFDRAWVIVDAAGKFITQREQPRLALVQPHLPTQALLMGAEAASHLADAALTLTAPGMQPLVVPLQPPHHAAVRLVKVWQWQGAGLDEGPAAAEWLSAYLGLPARLVRHAGAAAGSAVAQAVQAAAAQAQTKGQAACAPLDRPANETFALGWNIRFQDQFPLLVTTEASLAALSTQLDMQCSHGQDLPMTRFRPNLVVAGAEQPWAEDTWHTLVCAPAMSLPTPVAPAEAASASAAGEAMSSEPAVPIESAGGMLQLVLAKPCMRCRMVRVDQETAQQSMGQEPSETLSRVRNGEVLGWSDWHKSFKLGHFFGWLSVPLVAAGPAGAVKVAVGDSVSVSVARQLLEPGVAPQPIVNPLRC